ncbi:MAG: helix-turn-helix transcriptional regulator [Eubacteriales bacterium]|nr:helix-turn-helix transcriptional regulator [Eubacteriales bacterium]
MNSKNIELKIAMVQHGVTQGDFAKMIGKSTATVSRILANPIGKEQLAEYMKAIETKGV